MKTELEQLLKGVLFNIEDDSITNAALKRLYKYVGTVCVEELSFDFEDNFFCFFIS